VKAQIWYGDRVESVRRAISYRNNRRAGCDTELLLQRGDAKHIAAAPMGGETFGAMRKHNESSCVSNWFGPKQSVPFGSICDMAVSRVSRRTVTRSGHTRICRRKPLFGWKWRLLAAVTPELNCRHILAGLGTFRNVSWKHPRRTYDFQGRLTALLHLIECVEGADEDLASPSRFAGALSW